MEFNEMLKKYAQLIAKAGINVQKDQLIYISAAVDNAPFTRLVVEEVYKSGAKEVYVNWVDDTVSKLGYEYSPIEVYENIPEWQALRQNSSAQQGAGYISIVSSDPDAMAGIDPKKPMARAKAADIAFKTYRECMDKGMNTWCVVATPSPKWAKKVFSDLPEEKAVEKLWEAICRAVRIDAEDPIAAWEEHRKSFEEKSTYLNEKQFEKLHFESKNGTNFTVGMLKNHNWTGGGDKTAKGVYYFPNMPTEEIFVSPDRMIAEGKVVASKPLSYQGTLIENFSFTFKNGEIVDFTAEKGYDALKALVNTDEGSKRLGEVALVPAKSPISEMGILFYNTLFDENAACHLAIGRGFNECIQGGASMSKEELKEKGMNISAVHVDFMFGTEDMKIVGIDKNGKETVIFEKGNWA